MCELNATISIENIDETIKKISQLNELVKETINSIDLLNKKLNPKEKVS